MKYRIDVSLQNPTTISDDRGNTIDWEYANNKTDANNRAYTIWNHGYWVTIWNDKTNELLAGPFDPEKAHRDFLI